MPDTFMNPKCLFCKIINGSEKSHVIFQNEEHIAFLTPYPNTPGMTVVATKAHKDSNVLNLDKEKYISIMMFARKVSGHLNRALKIKRTGLIAEGMGVDHAHVKLIPMHGIPEGKWKKIESGIEDFSEKYCGYLSSADGPLMDDEKLEAIAQTIRNSIK